MFLEQWNTFHLGYMYFPGRGTHITWDMCFLKRGNTFYQGCVFFKKGKHILLLICVLRVVELILLGMCVSYVGEHISQVRFVD